MELYVSRTLLHTVVFVVVECLALLDSLNILFPAETHDLKCPLLSPLLYFIMKMKLWAQMCVRARTRGSLISSTTRDFLLVNTGFHLTVTSGGIVLLGQTNEMEAVRRAVLSAAIIQTCAMLHLADGCGYRSPKSLLFSRAAKGNVTQIVPTYSQ